MIRGIENTHMKILVLTNSGGGLYLFRRELMQRLVNEGHRVTVSVPSGEYDAQIRSLGCELLPCGLLDRRGINPLTDLKLYTYYRRLLRDRQPDVVLTYTIKPDIYGAYACRKEKIPYISTVTGLGSVFEGDGIKKRLLRAVVVRMYRAALKDCRCLFFQNRANQQVFAAHGIKAKRQRLVNGSGVDLTAFPEHPLSAAGDGASGPPVQFAFIGRVMREKGIEEYLSAAAHIKKRYPETTFHVCGAKEEEYRGRLELAVQKGVVTYHGDIADTAAFLKGIHCVVLPSYHEGMNNVLQEAAASGRAAITTDIPGCREIVEDSKTGFLICVRDVNTLTEAMERFLHLSQEERDAMGRTARRKMEREFDRKLVTDAYMKEMIIICDGC